MVAYRLCGLVVALAGICGMVSSARGGEPAADANKGASGGESKVTTADSAKSVLDFTVKDIDGKDVPLEKYRGKAVLIVNVASKCGLTPQYEELQELHQHYAADGLVILGFPANNFLSQEPGTNEEIKTFCTSKYGVEFDMFAKVSVKGDDQCELYKFLTSEKSNPDYAGELEWNFTKFLIGRDGKIVGRFGPRTQPIDPKVIAAIEAALKSGDASEKEES